MMTGNVQGDHTLMGDGLAILGGVLAALYLLVGRIVRRQVDIGPYGAMLCGACALLLLPIAVSTATPMSGFKTTSWAVLGAMALGPQLAGHIGFNYAVRYVPAAVVAAATLLEPVGAAALAALILGEHPSLIEIAGAVVAVAGVGVATVVPLKASAGAS